MEYYSILSMVRCLRSNKNHPRKITYFFIAVTVLATVFNMACRPIDRKALDLSDKNHEVNDKATDNGGPEETVFMGYYLEYKGAKYFKRSPGGGYFKVIDRTQHLAERYGELITLVNQPVYAILRGTPDWTVDGSWKNGTGLPVIDALSEVYGNPSIPSFTAIEVIEIDNVKRWNRVFPSEFRCYGEEPFWSLDIIKDQEAIFRDIGGSTVHYLPYDPPEIDSDNYTYQFTDTADNEVDGEMNSDRDAMHVIIEDTGCTDPMSGEMFEYSVKITFLGKTWIGCAEV